MIPIPPSGVLQFSGASYSTAENNASVMVTVMRINGSFGEVTVDYSSRMEPPLRETITSQSVEH